ncbi:FliO/MopB family protein [Entomospira entomophila]|uniref:FliO/MopB family protein n=1 Tax=Entomospira entomophila TaxID=2719988 RepID=A0A968GCM5_9SPIO|nr:flagellar biosynthetic protein FliO [Entomospira entomophilus]NIZ40494.1 FliO/MopB family protein [Entomospira entomophilus]
MDGLLSYAQESQNFPTTDESIFLLEKPTTDNTNPTASQSIGFLGFLQAFLSLIFVLGLIYLTIFFLKKFSGKQSMDSSHIQVLETQTLKSGSLINIVEIADRIFILGIGENITPIAEITDKESIDKLRLAYSHKTSSQPQRFMTLLQGRFTQAKSEENHRPIAETPLHNKDFLKSYTHRLHQSKEPFQEDNHNE